MVTFPRADRPPCHLIRRVGREQGLELARVPGTGIIASAPGSFRARETNLIAWSLSEKQQTIGLNDRFRRAFLPLIGRSANALNCPKCVIRDHPGGPPNRVVFRR
jgi:hypothetical protein